MKKRDTLIFVCTIILCLFGILMIYSSSNVWSLYKFNDAFKFVRMQFIFFILGLILIFIISRIDISYIYKYSNYLLIGSFIILVLVLIPGIGIVRNGSRSWFGIGGFGIQPSEVSKICLIIFVSKYLSNNDLIVKDIKECLLPLFLIIGIFCLLIMLEPDFGTMMVILLTLICLIFVSGPNISFFIRIGLLGIVGIVLLIAIAPYRLARITSYLNPWSDPLGSGFQVIMSMYAIVPSGILGIGFNKSIQKNFYLPEPQTDFIYSIICEEFGFLGAIFVIIIFLLLFYRAIKIALSIDNLFLKYLCFGLSFEIMLQALLNMMVVSSLIPCTGITLPFLSYGGSSLLSSMMSIGIILNISRYRK